MRRFSAVFLLLSCVSSAGCNVNSLLGLGGGGKPTVTVVVAPKTQSVVVATTQQFAAKVTGSSNTAVAWSVGGAACAAQDCGSISATGLYSAPKSIPNPALLAVTASASANPVDFGAAAVTIIAAPAAAAAPAMLRGTYTFLLSGADPEGPLSIGGTFEADGSGQLLNGVLRLCHGESHCSDQAFAGTTASTDANHGTFTADILPESQFTFSLSQNNILKVDLADSHNLRASGILRPDSSPADN
jgi:hypothetical protein